MLQDHIENNGKTMSENNIGNEGDDTVSVELLKIVIFLNAQKRLFIMTNEKLLYYSLQTTMSGSLATDKFPKTLAAVNRISIPCWGLISEIHHKVAF